MYVQHTAYCAVPLLLLEKPIIEIHMKKTAVATQINVGRNSIITTKSDRAQKTSKLQNQSQFCGKCIDWCLKM